MSPTATVRWQPAPRLFAPLRVRILWMLSVWLLGCCTSIGYCDDTNTQSQPNVLLIAVDDLNDWIGCMRGHPQAKTPNIDRLAARGTLFTNAHCQAPLCGPSRASLLSGRYPFDTGMYLQPLPDRLDRDRERFRGHLLPEYFARHGYRTLAVGKITHGYSPRRAFQEYGGKFVGFGPKPAGGRRLHYTPPKVPWTGTLTDWGAFPERDDQLSDFQAASWAEDQLQRKFERPFFMAVGFVRPHVPFYVPQHWFDQIPLDEVQLPPCPADDLQDLPSISRAVHALPKYPDREYLMRDGDENFRRCVRAYLACVRFVDHQIGRVLDALQNSDYADNTVIVLFSDHGYHLGEKHRVSKHSLWEESTRVPLCVVPPARSATEPPQPAPRPGQRVAQPVGLIDIYPTLVELCGLPANQRNQGQSLLPLLRDPNTPQRAAALTTYGRGNHAVRGQRYRYIRYRDGAEELYDHQVDPYEWTNLAGQEKYADVQARLASYLPKHDAPYHSATRRASVNPWFDQHLRADFPTTSSP